ncbi:VWA domain-containing protein [Pseudomonas aeruginosa]
MNSAENVRRCLLIRHLSHGEDSRLNRCPGSVDHYNQVTEERLYDQLMEEFPSWIREASAKGIIG